MLLINNSSGTKLNKEQLTTVFFEGCKQQKKTGIETEKLLIYKNSHAACKYEDVVKILNSFDSVVWQKIYEDESLIGLTSDTGTISLEPGSQIELSLMPFENLNDITEKLTVFYNNLSLYADKLGISVLDSGIQPVSTYNNIDIIPKKRYAYMTKYLPSKGLTPYIMMRETAGIQVNFDYSSEDDAIKKLSTALKMSPLISAIYSNSPVRNSKNTGYKSFRANSWLNVDEERCGYINKRLFEKNTNFSFADYTETLLDVPMIFIQREHNYYETEQTFREFMEHGYKGLNASLSDWENHISLYFPDVRLKSYIEIRNHDAQNALMTFSVPAFWKGIMYNKDALDEAGKMLSKYNYDDFIQLRKTSPEYGIQAKLGNLHIIDLIKEFFDISYSSLKENKQNEEKYLEPVYEYITLKRVPADDLIERYNF